MIDKDIEIEHLKKALEESKKENKALKGKLKTAKSKKDKAQQELKSLKKNFQNKQTRRRMISVC